MALGSQSALRITGGLVYAMSSILKFFLRKNRCDCVVRKSKEHFRICTFAVVLLRNTTIKTNDLHEKLKNRWC